MRQKPVIARIEKRDGKPIGWRIIIPRELAGGKRKTIRIAGTGPKAQREAERRAAAVDSARQLRLDGYELLSAADKLYIASELARLGDEWKPTLPKAISLWLAQAFVGEPVTVGDAIRQCLEQKKQAGLSDKYRKQLLWSLRKFELRFGSTECQNVTGKEIESWIQSLAYGPHAQKSILTDVQTLFSFALNRNYVTKNPAVAVPRPKISNGEKRILTVDEAERLMRSLETNDPGLIPVVALVLFGGFRPEEAARCRWENITDEKVDLPAGKTKNNERRLIERSRMPTIDAWLKLKCDWPTSNYRKRFMAVRSKVNPPIIWSHDILRKSFCSYAVPIYGESKAARLADHSEAVMRKHYLALVPESEAERFWKILPLQQVATIEK